MAISNPYGFSLDNPFSQQPSFIGDAAGNIVGSKKKSRVGLADGKKVNSPEEQINTEGKIAAASQRLQEDLDARETLANDRTFQFEMGGGDPQATANIIKGDKEHKVDGQVVYDGHFLVSYKDNADPPRRTIGGINQDALPNDHPLKYLERVLPVDYIEHHQKRLQEANDWVSERAETNSNYEYAREPLVDMYFNIGKSFYKKFPNMIKAIEAGNWETAGDEVLLNKAKDGPSDYAIQVGGRADDNSKLLSDLSTLPIGELTESSSTVEDSVEEKNKRHFTEPFVDRKVSNRFKLFEPKNLTEKALQGYQDLEDKLFKYADDVRKLSFGMQLEDAYPENSQSRKNIEDNFAFIIDDMADQVIRGQAYINTNNYTKFIPENSDESVYGGASDLRGVSKLEKYRKQELVDYLHEMYQPRVYDVVNSGLTEEEVMASSPKSIRELKDSVPGDRHIDAGHALEHRARKKYKDAKDPFLVDPNKTKPKAKPMPNPSQKSIITKPKFLDI
jgi:hypothetical protein